MPGFQCGYLKKGVFTLVPSEFRIWAPYPSTKCERYLIHTRNTYLASPREVRAPGETQCAAPIKPYRTGVKKIAANILASPADILSGSSRNHSSPHVKSIFSNRMGKLGFNGRSIYRAEASFCSIGGKSSKLFVYLSRCNRNLEGDSQEKRRNRLGGLLTVKSLAEIHFNAKKHS